MARGALKVSTGFFSQANAFVLGYVEAGQASIAGMHVIDFCTLDGRVSHTCFEWETLTERAGASAVL